MKTIGTVLCGCTLAVMTGCAPQLAQSPLGPQEQEWSTFLKDAYPEWDAPKTLPPVQKLDKQAAHQVDAVDDIPVDVPVVDIETPAVEVAVEEDSAAALTILDQEPFVPGATVHTVAKGDTLWKIAKRYYASGAKWRMIFDANKDLLKDPNALKLGMELRIPE